MSVGCTKDNYLERSSPGLNLTIIIMAIIQNLRNMERALDGNNNKIWYTWLLYLSCKRRYVTRKTLWPLSAYIRMPRASVIRLKYRLFPNTKQAAFASSHQAVVSASYLKYLTRYQNSEISLVPNDCGILIVKVSKYIPFCCLLLAQSEQ